jgi:3'(2'), 5'-bisphosphate nucleotidase
MLKVDQYLHTLINASLEAGRSILDIYASDFNVSYKDDHSPLTLADRRSNDIITSCLSAPPFNRFPILSEEGRDIPFKERENWEYFWLVDPLDGTKEFVRRNGEFTVNIALIKRNRPVAGVIYIPVKDIFYFAAEGSGAYRLADSEIVNHELTLEDLLNESDRLPLPYTQSPEAGNKSPVKIIASRSHLSPETEDFICKTKDRHGEVEIISSGSSLKFCLIAEGAADIYPRFGPTMEWDTAAGQCIVEEAGGKVLHSESMEPLKYNKEDLLNPWFLVVNTQLAHAHGLSELLGKHKQ